MEPRRAACNFTRATLSKCEERDDDEERSLSCERNDGGGIMKGLLCKAVGVMAERLVLAHLCEAIMMHEGPLHVYDMIVSDLLAAPGD